MHPSIPMIRPHSIFDLLRSSQKENGDLKKWEMSRRVIRQDLPLSLPLFITIVNLQEVANPNPDPNPNPPL